MPAIQTNTPPAPYKSWAAYYASIEKEVAPQQTSDATVPNTTSAGMNKAPESKENVYVAPKVKAASTQDSYASQVAEKPISTMDATDKTGGTSTEVVTPEVATTQAEAGSFDAWYETNYGESYNGQALTKTDDMSATEFAVGQNLYYTEQAEKSLKEDYDNNLKEIAAGQSKDEQQAYILYEKLKRYLGMSSAAQGKGVDSGDMIAAGNNYQNTLSGIKDTYGDMKTDLTKGYNTNKLQNSQQSQSELYSLYAQEETNALIEQAAIDAAAAGEAANNEAMAEYVGQVAYSHITGMVDMFEVDENGNISYADYQSLLTYYEKYKSQMSEGTKKQVEMFLEDDITHGEDGILTTETDYANFLEGNTTVKYNGVDYVKKTDGLRLRRPGGDTYADYKNGDILVDADLYHDSDWKTNPNERTYIFYDGYFYEINKK